MVMGAGVPVSIGLTPGSTEVDGVVADGGADMLVGAVALGSVLMPLTCDGGMDPFGLLTGGVAVTGPVRRGSGPKLGGEAGVVRGGAGGSGTGSS